MSDDNQSDSGKDKATSGAPPPKSETPPPTESPRPVVGLSELFETDGPSKRRVQQGRLAKPAKARGGRKIPLAARQTNGSEKENSGDGEPTSQSPVSLAMINEPDDSLGAVTGRKLPGSFATFIVVAISGSIVLAMPQGFGISGLVKFFFAIAMVALYGGCGLVFQWYQPKRGGQRYIDNVYFLGFLYTQVGLVAGFMELWQSSTVDASGIRRITSDELIPIIAAALGASALGLLFKIVLDEVYELRVTSDSATDEEKWREELARASEKLKFEVDGVIDHFQKLSKHVVAVSSEIASAVQLASTTAQTVESNGLTIAGSVQQLRPALEQFHERLVSAGDTAAQSIRELHGDLESASRSLKDIATAAQGMGRVVEHMDGVVGQLEGVVKTTVSASNVAETASNDFKNEARARIHELARRLEELTQTASTDARNGFATTIREIEGELERTRDALGRHVEKFAGAVRDFNSKVDGR